MDHKARSHQKYITAFDGVRGLAVILVFLLHTAGGASSSQPLLRLFGNAIRTGWSGVTLFFLLSGFLITGILWDSKGASHWWRNFYLRRAVRILPLYFGSLLLMVVVAWCTGTLANVARYIWIYFAYLQNVPLFWADAAKLVSPLYIYHFWSIAVEEQFYLFWPVLIALTRTRKQAAWSCVVVFLASLAFRFWAFGHMHDTARLSQFLPSRAGELALGGLLGLAYRSGWWVRLVPWLPTVLLVSGAGFVAVALRSGVSLADPQPFTIGLACCTIFWAAFLALAVQPGMVQRAMDAGWLRWIGRISYGVYIYHVLLIGVFSAVAQSIVHAGRGNAFAGTRFLVAGVGTLAVAWLSFNYFEKPFLRLKKYF